jgi:hypothetical protein
MAAKMQKDQSTTAELRNDAPEEPEEAEEPEKLLEEQEKPEKPMEQQPLASKESNTKKKRRKKKKLKGGWKREPGQPKRPLTAYNFFFQHERAVILSQIPSPPESSSQSSRPGRSHGKIGFARLARTISSKWSQLDRQTRKYFDHLAMLDKERYAREKHQWKLKKEGETAGPGLSAAPDPCMSAAPDPCRSAASPQSFPGYMMGGCGLPPAPGFNVPAIARYHIERQHHQRHQPHHPVTPPSSRRLLGDGIRMSPRFDTPPLQTRSFPETISSNTNCAMWGGAMSIVGHAIALIEQDLPAFHPVDEPTLERMESLEDDQDDMASTPTTTSTSSSSPTDPPSLEEDDDDDENDFIPLPPLSSTDESSSSSSSSSVSSEFAGEEDPNLDEYSLGLMSEAIL